MTEFAFSLGCPLLIKIIGRYSKLVGESLGKGMKQKIMHMLLRKGRSFTVARHGCLVVP